MQCTSERSYASVMPRIMAYLIDMLCVGIVTGSVVTFAAFFEALGLEDIVNKGILFQYSIVAILTFIIKKLYFIIFVASSGQTLGKMCFRIKVVNNDGSKVSFWNVVYREFIGRYLSEVFCFLGYVGVLVDFEKRALHDWLCDTRVIYDTSINNEKVYKRKVFTPINNRNSNATMPNNMYVNNMQGGVVPVAAPINNMQNDVEQNNQLENDVQDNIVKAVESKNNAEINNELDNAIENEIEITESKSDSNIELILEETNGNSQHVPPQVVEEQIMQEEAIQNELINEEDLSRREINKDIVSAYSADLDYSTQFTFDEDDAALDFETKELDELLEKLDNQDTNN